LFLGAIILGGREDADMKSNTNPSKTININ